MKNTELFRIIADNGLNTKVCYEKVQEYITKITTPIKKVEKPVKKTVKKKEN